MSEHPTHGAAMHWTPIVPRLDQVQPGYEIPCHPHDVAGATVRVFTIPGGVQDPARTVVCVPGLGASGRSFALMAPLAREHRLLFWTPPLKTPAPVTPLEHNLELLAHPAAKLPDQFVLVGSSYGSLIALAFAIRHPERIRALVLASPVASTRRIRRPAIAATAFLRVPLPFTYAFAPIVARVLGGWRLPPEGRSEITREARRITPVEMVRRLKDIITTDLLPQLDTFSVPTLIVHGRRDHVVPLSNARDVASRIRNAHFHVIPGAAHLPYMSHPDAFNSVVGKFLGALPLR